MRNRILGSALTYLSLLGCPSDTTAAARDARVVDAGAADSRATDRASRDTRVSDRAQADVRQSDAHSMDASLPDHSAQDLAASDLAQADHPSRDQGAADAAGDVRYITVVAAGDIAQSGKTDRARAAAALITAHQPAVSAVILTGDNARYSLTSLRTLLSYYEAYYQPADEANWGQFDVMTYPQLGNHEYSSGNPQGYFDYFASRLTAIAADSSYAGYASDTQRGYYSVDLNGWHLVSLNSECVSVSCAAGGEQEQWLAADLAAHANMPIIAAWHAPRYACGGAHDDARNMQALWADLVDAGADFVFTGHDHYYQRWFPLDKSNPQAVRNDSNGLVEIVAGSTGVSTYSVCDDGSGHADDPRVARQIGGDAGIGVLFLTLGSDGSYSFEYRLISDGSVFDSGSGMSHHAH